MFSTRDGFATLALRGACLLLVVALSTAAFAGSSNAVPVITFLSPVSATPGGADFTLTVNGANFVDTLSVVNWTGTPLTTTFVSSEQLTATVPAALIASGGTGWISVSNLNCGGECPALTSNVFYFPVQNVIATYTAVELTATVGSVPYQISQGDFNGDGKLDLAVSNFSSNTLSILLGNGDGTFQAQTTYNTLARPFGIAIGDVNGDGISDLVVGNDSTGLNVLLGDGSGGFNPGVSLSGGNCPTDVILADLNQDGALDIVAGNECGSGLEVYLGVGDGTFGPATPVSGNSPVFGLVVADFNGDGILDIAAASYARNNIDVYLGVGDGTFGPATHISAPTQVVRLAAGDFNLDGKVDLVAASESGAGITILFGDGNGGFPTRSSLVSTGSYFAVAAGDLSGDGNLDIVGIQTSGTVQVWFSSGAGTFQAPQTLGTSSAFQIALGNFATGGGLDIAAGNTSTSKVDIFLPTVIISPSSKNFGSVGLGTSAQQVFTVTNDTATTVTISGISLTGTTPGDFSQNNTCSTPLASGANCTVTVTFVPAATGARSATLTITDDAPITTQTALLSGTGTAAPVATISPASLSFGSQTLHVTTASQPVTLTNTGNASLTGLAISITGTNSADFAQTNNCTSTMATNATCTVNVTFTASAAGAESASLQFADNAAGSPQQVALSGSGLAVPTKVNYSTPPPASISAGSSIGVISVGVYDAGSNLVTVSSASITVTITGPNAFSQNQTATASSGVASFDFTSVPLDIAGQYTVTATSNGLTPAASMTTVTAMVSSSTITVSGYPSPTYAGVEHGFTVSVQDSFGNVVTSYTGTVTVSSSDSSALITPVSHTFAGADMGTFVFSAALVTLGSQTISATDGELSGSQSGIVVNARPQLVVNLLEDDAGTASSSCDGSVPCSLRSAINQVNTLGAGDITVDTSSFAGSAPWTSTLTNGAFGINSDLSISGPGAGQLSFSGNDVSSVFQIVTGAIATIQGVTITHGSSSGNGGAITNAGSLTLSNAVVSNSAAAQSGGGIYSSGTLTVNASEISGNTAGGDGGGAASTGTSVIYDSTLSGNTATGNGGAVDNSGTLSVPQSTFSGNNAADGSGMENEASGTLVMAQSTVSGNIASSGAGGTVTNQNSGQAAVTIVNSVVAGNTAPGGDCVSCGAQDNSNIFDVGAVTLKLGALAQNGGPTRTLLPLAGSPAIGGGSVGLVTDSGLPQSLANDQRGNGYVRVVNNAVDLGAVQYNSGPVSSLSFTVTGSTVAGNTLTFTLHALTASGNPDGTYTGTIHFTSTDPQAVLPADYTFVLSDNGTHVFTVTLATSGAQSVTATDTVVSSLQAVQSVSESPAAAATVTTTAGSGQTANVGVAFATLLAVKVSDAFGNAVPGTTVVFTAPSSGASGTFVGGAATALVVSGNNGVATAPAFTANNTAGQYSVSAAAQGLTAVTFALINVIPPDYSIAANPASLTIAQGQSGSTVLTITPVGGMAGTLSFVCTGLPAKASCVFAPTQVVMSGNGAVQTVTLTVHSTGPNGILSEARPGSSTNRTAISLAALLLLPGGFLCLTIPGWRKKDDKRRRSAYFALLLLLGGFTALGMTACGGSSSSPATPLGQYTVTAGASVSGSNSHSALVTITITK